LISENLRILEVTSFVFEGRWDGLYFDQIDAATYTIIIVLDTESCLKQTSNFRQLSQIRWAMI
jgi:hypothetical protein